MALESVLAPVAEWFRTLYETTGLNFSVFYDPYDARRFFKGIVATVTMAAICMALSIAIGIVVAGLQRSRRQGLVLALNAYIQFFRNTPSVVQLYFFFFGLGPLIAYRNEMGQMVPWVDAYTWAVVCLSIYSGAFNAEIFRAGVEAVNRSTVEAAEALGYTPFGVYVHVVLPLAFRYSFPAFSTNMVNLIKSTSIAYAIAVPETLYMVSQIWSERLNVAEMMNVLLVTYVLIVSVFLAVAGSIERRLRVPGIGA